MRGKTERKQRGIEEKEKGQKNGDLNIFLFILYKSTRRVFSYVQWSFLDLKSRMYVE